MKYPINTVDKIVCIVGNPVLGSHGSAGFPLHKIFHPRTHLQRNVKHVVESLQL